jgi:hypothetical protein
VFCLTTADPAGRGFANTKAGLAVVTGWAGPAPMAPLLTVVDSVPEWCSASARTSVQFHSGIVFGSVRTLQKRQFSVCCLFSPDSGSVGFVNA